MPIVRTAVLLYEYSEGGQKVNVEGDRLWWSNYFFGPVHGQAGFWMKQTDGNVIVDGTAFDWVAVVEPWDLSNRHNSLQDAIAAAEDDRGIDFAPFDVVILVIGASKNVKTIDQGSAHVSSQSRSHAGIVISVGTSFDVTAHEIGHAIGVDHSFGSPLFQAASWSMPGEYGHPYCVMSAASYGGIGGPFYPTQPRDGHSEFSGLGPGLNAATALARGGLDAHVHQLPGVREEVELRSRHWLGRAPGLAPQALELEAADGRSFVVEYRVNEGWDEGQGSPAVIVNGGKGSTADLAHPNTSSATYLGLAWAQAAAGVPVRSAG